MGMIILDKEADDKFKVNLKAISKITEQLKVSAEAEANNPKKAKGKKQKHNFVSNF